MKKTLLFLSMLTSSVYAQKCDKENYFSVSVAGDIRNCIIGSEPTGNKPSADLLIGLHAVGNNFEINPEVELFPKIGYWSSGANFGYHLPYWYIPARSKEMNLSVIPMAGIKMINRYNQEERQLKNGDWVYSKSSHITAQIGGSIRLDLSDKIMLDLSGFYSGRPDLVSRWPESHKAGVFSSYLGIHYKLN